MDDLHPIVTRVEGDWRETRVLVIGDVMLDRYIWGDVERISPEAPVPVVRLARRSEQPGGAANVAMNIAGLGAKVTLAGFAGNDEERSVLEACLDRVGVDTQLTIVDGHPTTSKLRILGGQQQILRLDVEKTKGYPEDAYASMLRGIIAVLPEVRAVVLSDYAKGVLSEQVCREVIDTARRLGIPVLVDPKHRDFSRYRGATTICPNLQELSVATGIPPKEIEPLLEAATAMLPALELDYLTVTLSEKGIAVVRPGGTDTYPAVARQVFDVSGAGDTVIATLALSLASGLPIEAAVRLANIAAGVVVSKVGTVPITRDELITSLMPEIELQASEKLLELAHLQTRVGAWRSKGQRVVFTNGCFDLLHVGHITLMEDARRQGDRLVVAINSDRSVSELKGPTRPVVQERDRGRVLAALAAVDAVIVFDEPTPLELIIALKPDVIVKGGDYVESTVVGAKEVRSWGGEVKIVPTVEGFSTSKLIARAATPSR
ncbi:bifunctional D-glycero-beta-D-manno-heptose-7-phosphate kinase/D-glycero-beta-D-manno-heptose 1-phosphate adenylyltransferase HldE [Acidipila sp. EB88]|nr:bifunctional D-glycero-beta-D-manno-heptose-7-phosphate kinase/D-glycero-beta-D-manno-heptose 1-phosphate adenylyltransferase HldE [Acidipila sp. EB88]